MSGLTLLTNDLALESWVAGILGGDHVVRRVWADSWRSPAEASAAICAANPLIVAVGPDIIDADATELLRALDVYRPEIGVVVFRSKPTQGDTVELLRQGAREVIDTSLANDAGVRTALDRVFALVAERLATASVSQEPIRRAIAVLSPKGGTGKTTMATNLAVGLARSMPGQVVLVDLDLQFGDVSSALGLTPEHSIADAAGGGQVDLTSLKLFLARHDSGLAVLAAPSSLADADDIDSDNLKQVLTTLSDEFPIVIVDTAAGIDEAAMVALEFATDLLFVSTTDVPAIRAIAKQVEALNRLRMVDQRRHFLLNRSDAKVGLSQEDIEATVGMKANFTVPSSRVIPLSTNQGVPHVDANANDAPGRALRELVEAFLPPTARDRAGRRFLRKGRS